MAYIPRLDSLRFLAALAVIGNHWGSILPWGWMGVPLFFVLSGFLITGILIRARDASLKIGEYLRTFYFRRALRIMPLYYLFVVLITLFYFIFREPPSFPQAAPYLYTYTLNFAQMLPSYTNVFYYNHLWSLDVEWQFYLAWPLIVFWLPRKWLFPFLILMIFIAPVMRAITQVALEQAQVGTYRVGDTIFHSTLTYADAFAFGAILNWKAVAVFFQSNVVFFSVMILFALGGIAPMHWSSLSRPDLGDYGYDLGSNGQAIWGYTMLNLVMTIIIASTLGNSVLNRLTDLPFMQRMGKISYGIYVYHPVFVFGGLALAHHLAESSGMRRVLELVFTLPMLGLTILAAHLSYEYFEKIFLRLKSKVPRVGVPEKDLVSGTSVSL